LVAPQPERLLVCRSGSAAEVKTNHYVRVENDGMRRLRGGTRPASVRTVAAHYLNGVFFSPTTAERCLPGLSIKLLIFPNFEPFSHELFEQTNRISPSLPSGFFKAIP